MVTFYAGMVPTADELNDLRPRYAIATVTESVASSATPQDDDELFLDLPANSRWVVELDALFSGITNGARIDWTAPGDATLTSLRHSLGPEAASVAQEATLMRVSAFAIGTDADYGIDTGSATVWGTVRETFIIDFVSAGRLQLRWCQVVSNAVAVNRRSGSWLCAERIL